MPRAALAVSFLAWLGAGAPRSEGTPPAPDMPVVRVSLEVVQVDVVTDQQGNHVTEQRSRPGA